MRAALGVFAGLATLAGWCSVRLAGRADPTCLAAVVWMAFAAGVSAGVCGTKYCTWSEDE